MFHQSAQAVPKIIEATFSAASDAIALVTWL
jgi:hypothetical protein